MATHEFSCANARSNRGTDIGHYRQDSWKTTKPLPKLQSAKLKKKLEPEYKCMNCFRYLMFPTCTKSTYFTAQPCSTLITQLELKVSK